MEAFEWVAKIMESMNTAVSLVGIAAYVLSALALYTIATRRAIKKAWLAWVPVLNMWILGSIADQYRYVTKGEVKNRRKVLLGLSIASAVVILIMAAMMIWIVLEMLLVAGGTFMSWIGMLESGNIEPLIAIADKMVLPFVFIALLALPMAILSAVLVVFYWIAMYDVFRSCDPANSVVYLIASIVGGFVISGIECIFLMICRNKDLGMPPRKPDIIDEAEPQPENDIN